MTLLAALVLFMTIPGLSAFYAGIVKRKNMLSVLMQCFSLTCLMTLMWYSVGYSLSFSELGNGVLGGLDKAFLAGVTKASVWETIPEALWALYQMTFAIITPALMVGSFVERMKFSAVMWYCSLWMFAVYFPACHMVWGPGGAMAAAGVLDFAGGIVVHITAGIGALVGAAVLGPRKENKMVAGNLVLTVLGTGMLWVGWYGFNGGSALAAGADAAFACLATQIAAATAAIVWTAQDIAETGKASMLGIATGSIAGLATVTPCAGFVGPLGALLLGVAGGVVCRFFSLVVKEKYGYDDSLDVFGVHGVGGFIGTCLLGIVAAPALGGLQLRNNRGGAERDSVRRRRRHRCVHGGRVVRVPDGDQGDRGRRPARARGRRAGRGAGHVVPRRGVLHAQRGRNRRRAARARARQQRHAARARARAPFA
jgi:ammonium transporter